MNRIKLTLLNLVLASGLCLTTPSHIWAKAPKQSVKVTSRPTPGQRKKGDPRHKKKRPPTRRRKPTPNARYTPSKPYTSPQDTQPNKASHGKQQVPWAYMITLLTIAGSIALAYQDNPFKSRDANQEESQTKPTNNDISTPSPPPLKPLPTLTQSDINGTRGYRYFGATTPQQLQEVIQAWDSANPNQRKVLYEKAGSDNLYLNQTIQFSWRHIHPDVKLNLVQQKKAELLLGHNDQGAELTTKTALQNEENNKKNFYTSANDAIKALNFTAQGITMNGQPIPNNAKNKDTTCYICYQKKLPIQAMVYDHECNQYICCLTCLARQTYKPDVDGQKPPEYHCPICNGHDHTKKKAIYAAYKLVKDPQGRALLKNKGIDLELVKDGEYDVKPIST